MTEIEFGSALHDVLATATRGKFVKAAQYMKTGGFTQANRDFAMLTRGSKVVIRPHGVRTATLSNGTKINVRPTSDAGLPTVEIMTPGNPRIKIRY